MKKLETAWRWKVFIGHAKKQGATEEELDILTKAMTIVEKYSPVKPEK